MQRRRLSRLFVNRTSQPEASKSFKYFAPALDNPTVRSISLFSLGYSNELALLYCICSSARKLTSRCEEPTKLSVHEALEMC